MCLPRFLLSGRAFKAFDFSHIVSTPLFPLSILTPRLSRMVVGPEAAGSLLVGTVVKSSVDSGGAGEDDDEVNFTTFCAPTKPRAYELSQELS
jgi:hypothetical protein